MGDLLNGALKRALHAVGSKRRPETGRAKGTVGALALQATAPLS
jgi:hypothetical protein